MNKKIEKLLSVPKSLYVCLKLFSFKDVIKLPILVRFDCKLKSLKGSIYINKGGKTSPHENRFWQCWYLR